MQKHKLSASALNTFLKSPKSYFWQYIKRLVPISESVGSFSHDKICGILWAEFVNRFYNGVAEQKNLEQTLNAWDEQTYGWCPEKQKDKLTKALETWGANYYQMFNPEDGARGKGKSELFVENERFLGYLDGLSDTGCVHEVKSTSRSPQLAGQLWKVENSIQVKLYCVLAKATGIQIEFAFKDPPYVIYRAQEKTITEDQLHDWEQELNKLADYIYSLGEDEHNYPCHPDGCCLVTKGMTSLCQYDTLCELGYSDLTAIAYKEKKRREQSA